MGSNDPQILLLMPLINCLYFFQGCFEWWPENTRHDSMWQGFVLILCWEASLRMVETPVARWRSPVYEELGAVVNSQTSWPALWLNVLGNVMKQPPSQTLRKKTSHSGRKLSLFTNQCAISGGKCHLKNASGKSLMDIWICSLLQNKTQRYQVWLPWTMPSQPTFQPKLTSML